MAASEPAWPNSPSPSHTGSAWKYDADAFEVHRGSSEVQFGDMECGCDDNAEKKEPAHSFGSLPDHVPWNRIVNECVHKFYSKHKELDRSTHIHKGMLKKKNTVRVHHHWHVKTEHKHYTASHGNLHSNRSPFVRVSAIDASGDSCTETPSISLLRRLVAHELMPDSASY